MWRKTVQFYWLKSVHFILPLTAAFSFSCVQSGSTKVTSIPIFAMVTAIRLNVPPYMLEDETM